MFDEGADLVAAIYEAGAMPEKWSQLLSGIGRNLGARGGVLMCAKHGTNLRTCPPEIEEVIAAFEREGWAGQNSRIGRLIERQPYAGFLADADIHSEEELSSMPMYTQFLNPRGYAAGSATMIQGAAGDGLILTIEGFDSHRTSIAAAPFLNGIRPHLARAAVLSGQLSLQRVRAAVEALAVMETPAAMLDLGGRVIAANDIFAAELGKRLFDRSDRLRSAHKQSDLLLGDAIEKLLRVREGSSLAIRDADGLNPIALHLVPISGDARDIFEMSAGLAILSTANNKALPSADLLQALFDLTPSEAHVARAIGQAQTVQVIADDAGLGVETIRTHLKRVMAKTGNSRQTELAVLIAGLAPPKNK